MVVCFFLHYAKWNILQEAYTFFAVVLFRFNSFSSRSAVSTVTQHLLLCVPMETDEIGSGPNEATGDIKKLWASPILQILHIFPPCWYEFKCRLCVGGFLE
jgi:hypothetical protein